MARSFFQCFCNGLPLILLVFFDLNTIAHRNYQLVAFFVFTLYQFHFVSTIYLQKKYIISSITILTILTILYSSLFAISDPNSQLTQIIFVFMFVGIIYHFAMQTYGLIARKIKIPKMKQVILALCFSKALYYYSTFNKLNFFEITVRLPFTLDQNFCLILSSLLAFLNIIYAIVHTQKTKSFSTCLLWTSHIIVWSPFIDFHDNFHLVALLHSIQYIPYYSYRIKQERHSLLKTFLILVISFSILVFLPNYLDQAIFTQISARPEFYITLFALVFNTHHFIFETYVHWKRSNKIVL